MIIKKEEKIKELKKEKIRKLPLTKRYKFNKRAVNMSNYTGISSYYITTPNIINPYTKEPTVVLRFNAQGLLGCCGSTVIGGMQFYEQNLITDNDEERLYLMNLMLNSQNTNNLIISDTTDVDEESSIFDLIKMVQPELKPVDSYFNQNSGNTVILYSYNKVKK